jgi:hypothetical protein
MKQSKPSILTCVKNVSILTLIVISMMLHLFINGTTNSYSSQNAVLFGQYHAANKTSTHTYSKILHSTNNGNQKVSLRFSKRFQFPSFILPAPAFLSERGGEMYVEQHKIGQPTTYLLFSVILAQSLRGPPLAA